MTGLRVVLASRSPRRRELLDLIGIPHDVRPPEVDEVRQPGETPAGYAERLAREKAHAVAAGDPDAVVIGADTIVLLDGEVLEKPVDARDAEGMLRRLSGRTHTVLTAVAVAHAARLVAGVESVEVTFRVLDDAQIAAYVRTGEPMDKAGAYGIQGFGAAIVRGVHGDYFAVMGLAIGLLTDLLTQLGLVYRFGPVAPGPARPAPSPAPRVPA